MSPLLKTPLHEEHLKLKGKMVPFAGYSMPVQYPTGIRAEHFAVRKTAGVFDVSHMGEFRVQGPEARDFVSYVTTNDVSRLKPGDAQYSAMCREDGGVIDDLLVYHMGEGNYRLVVNASNKQKDWDHLEEHAVNYDVTLRDESDEIALVAIQGPLAEVKLRGLTDVRLDTIRYYKFAHAKVSGVPCMVSRTGYTGEVGFELYLPAESASTVWRALLATGAIPAGLGARDSLRLEMGYALYGNDIDETTSALEAGLGWIVKTDKGDFIGRDTLIKQRTTGLKRKLWFLRLVSRGFPRPGYEVTYQGKAVDKVRSGTVSPSLGYGIATTYLPSSAKLGDLVSIVIRGKPLTAELTRQPFYGRGSLVRIAPRFAVLTISDGVHAGTREDTSGEAIHTWVDEHAFKLEGADVVPDNVDAIMERMMHWSHVRGVDCILTTGGTGLGPRDVTPEATAAVIQRPAPGIAEAIRYAGAKATPYAWLSRGLAGVRGETLIINFPGSPNGVRDGLQVLEPFIDHCIDLIRGETEHLNPPPSTSAGRPKN